MADCEQCEGTGYGPCDTCGDTYSECVCEDNASDDCQTCNGTGEVEDEFDDEEQLAEDEDDWEEEEE